MGMHVPLNMERLHHQRDTDSGSAGALAIPGSPLTQVRSAQARSQGSGEAGQRAKQSLEEAGTLYYKCYVLPGADPIPDTVRVADITL